MIFYMVDKRKIEKNEEVNLQNVLDQLKPAEFARGYWN